MGLSFWQIAIVVLLVVLLFGRGKLSALMGDLAKGIKSFKKGMQEDLSSSSQQDTIAESNESKKSETSDKKDEVAKS